MKILKEKIVAFVSAVIIGILVYYVKLFGDIPFYIIIAYFYFDLVNDIRNAGNKDK
jgi:hypothetical protein